MSYRSLCLLLGLAVTSGAVYSQQDRRQLSWPSDAEFELELDSTPMRSLADAQREAEQQLPPVPGANAFDGEPVTEAPAPIALPSVASPEPSGHFIVASGQGMGHVAQALSTSMSVNSQYSRVPEIWVAPEGGLIGLPHVIACYNRRKPFEWTFHVGQEVALPPLERIWPMVEYLKSEGTCPDADRAPRQEPVSSGPTLVADPEMEDFAAGGGFVVEAGRTYSHYGAAARRELVKLMPPGKVAPLYPVPGAPGIMNVMACWNTGDGENFKLRAGQVLRVPPVAAFEEAMTYMEDHSGGCPPDFLAVSAQ